MPTSKQTTRYLLTPPGVQDLSAAIAHVVAPDERVARQRLARLMGRQRLPRGSNVWAVRGPWSAPPTPAPSTPKPRRRKRRGGKR